MAKTSSFSFSNMGRWSKLQGNLPGTRENYAALAGVLYENPTVKAGLAWIIKNFKVPKLVATRGRGKGKGNVLDDHPALALFDRPNPDYDGDDLNSANLISLITAGEYFNYKVRNGYGVLKDLYYVHHDAMTPVGENGEFISYYEYQPGWGAEVKKIPAEDVLHVRMEMDPVDNRRGLSPLRALLREIASDNFASTYTASLLKNMGALPFFLSPENKEDVLSPEDAQKIKKMMMALALDGSGDVPVSPVSLKATNLGMSPEQMALDKIRHYPQDQTLAAIGLNSTALNLPSGAGTKTFSNFPEAIRQCYHGCLIPIQAAIANAWNTHIVPEFDDGRQVSLSWDYSGVKALQEDQTALVNCLTKEWQLGIIDRYTYLSQRGYKASREDKGVYYANPAAATPDKAEPAKNKDEESI